MRKKSRAAAVSAEVEATHNPDLRHPVDDARVVHSLEELYEACRTAPLPDLVHVTLRGPHGDLRLHFEGMLRPTR